MAELLRIGMIGAGSAAARIHAPGFALCPGVEISAVYDPDSEAAMRLGARRVYESAEDLLADEDVDAVVIATPNHLHKEVALKAAAAKKHILCEKPLALNARDGREMAAAAESAGIVHMTAFTYRFTPALQYLKHLVDSGALGRLRTVRAAYQMAMASHLHGWRSLRSLAGSGVLADVGSHLIHAALFVAGDIASLTATKRRFRTDPDSDVEDWIAFLAEFSSGASGTFEISRVCPGRGAGMSEEILIELYGEAGSALFLVQDPWALRVALGEKAADPSVSLER